MTGITVLLVLVAVAGLWIFGYCLGYRHGVQKGLKVGRGASE